MITADGWLDWTIRLPGNPAHVNGGINDARGIFLHSAEGYADNLIDLAVNGPLSWHLSNLMDGRVFQHFPLSAQCWHATSANNHYVGMEDEGVFTRETSLNEAQVANAVRVIKDLSALKGWTPKRPTSKQDTSHTLWEHNEVTRLGGSATACPSGRIPWDEILRRLNMPEVRTWVYGNEVAGCEQRGKQLIYWHNGIEVDAVGNYEGDLPGAHYHHAGDDAEGKPIWVEVLR